MNKNITFIGAGNMAEALISGFLRSGIVLKNRLTAADVRSGRLNFLKKKYGIRTEANNVVAVKGSDIIFLAVKPQQMETVLSGISSSVRRTQLVISLAAGIKTTFIEKFLNAAVVRSMPNTPALAGEGAIAISKGRWASGKDMMTAEKLFSTVGIVVKVKEELLNAVTALSGSGPAYIFYMAEAFEKAGMDMGLSEEVSRELSSQTIYGAGKLLKQGNLKASELRRLVTSPGGTTAAAISHFEKHEFLKIVKNALKEAKKRAGEISSPR